LRWSVPPLPATTGENLACLHNTRTCQTRHAGRIIAAMTEVGRLWQLSSCVDMLGAEALYSGTRWSSPKLSTRYALMTSAGPWPSTQYAIRTPSSVVCSGGLRASWAGNVQPVRTRAPVSSPTLTRVSVADRGHTRSAWRHFRAAVRRNWCWRGPVVGPCLI